MHPSQPPSIDAASSSPTSVGSGSGGSELGQNQAGVGTVTVGRSSAVEWPTVLLIVGCTAAILLISRFSQSLSLWLSVPALSVMLALHSSLQHEVLHGHPFHNTFANELLVSVPFGLYVAYPRFRDSHLQHHIDERLTDPHDDPESNYLTPAAWQSLSAAHQWLLNINNTLAGRVVVGPLIGMVNFYRADCRSLIQGDRAVRHAYLVHFIAMVPLLWWILSVSSMPLWAYAFSAYVCLSLLRVRTFLEHQASERVPCRTAIVEDRGFFSWLFLNNNFHLVHHMHPSVAWYKLPALYLSRREQFVARNNGYVFSSYWQVFSRYLFKCKDPVSHPLR